MQQRRRLTKQAGKRCKVNSQYNGRLVRLLLCIVLFFTVFAGKWVWPAQASEAGRRILSVIRSDTDFRAAFASLGHAMSKQESVLGELGEFCVSVFGATRSEQIIPSKTALEVMHAEVFPLDMMGQALTERYLRMDDLPEPFRIQKTVDSEAEAESETEPESQPPALRVGDVVQAVAVSDPALPEQYSEQWLYLGQLETTPPLLGRITSEFGYRDHPTIGRFAAHGGVDIGADTGATVVCFADGTVESSGENSDYGKYLLIRHADGVATFYAHCSKLCVKEGEHVEMGQKIAEVGATGQATGPHLHFEIRLNGTRLNPLYYIKPNAA